MVFKKGDLGRVISTDKKGQVTIFIIVGIIILFLFAGIFYFTRTYTTSKITEEGLPAIERASQEFLPIQAYTENCLLSTGKKGLRILGEQGGYIYPELVGQYSVIDPTNADGLNLEPLKVPYWYYNKQPNSASEIQLISLRPALSSSEDPEMSMEAQLARYVNDKIDDCLQDYAVFESIGFKVSRLEQKKVQSKITDGKVLFILDMPLEASKGSTNEKMEQFAVGVNLDLKKYYEISTQITQLEQNYSVMEGQALELVQIYSGVNNDKLAPTSATTFGFIPPIYWNTEDLKTKMHDLLTTNVPLLKFDGTNNFYNYQYPVSDLSPLFQKNHDNIIFPLPGAQGLDVNFDYFGWEPYLKVNDKNGQVKPTSLAAHFKVLNFGMQDYKTLYDISYPALVTINDEQALNGEGYKFVFALEANVRNNAPVVNEEKLLPDVDSFQESMICDADKFNSPLVKTIVVDSYTGEPLSGVNIGFSVPEVDNCQIGVTDQKGSYESRYPSVYGGLLSFINIDYLTSYYPLDTYKLDSQAVVGYALSGFEEKVIPLHRKVSVPVTVKKKLLERCVDGDCPASGIFGGGESVYDYKAEPNKAQYSWVYAGSSEDLADSEEAVFNFHRVSDIYEGVLSESYDSAVTVRGNEESAVELVPGLYQVSANIIDRNGLRIPSQQRCYDVLPSGILEKCFTLDEVNLDSSLSGEIDWNVPATYLSITPDDLYPAKKLVLYALSADFSRIPEEQRVIEDTQIFGELGNISSRAEIRDDLEPTFI